MKESHEPGQKQTHSSTLSLKDLISFLQNQSAKISGYHLNLQLLGFMLCWAHIYNVWFVDFVPIRYQI